MADDELILKVDDRETRKPGRVDAIKKKRSYKVEIGRVEVGDYVLGPYAFEWKDCVDLLGSIKGRLWQQLDELEANYEYPFLVINLENVDYQLCQNPRWRSNGRLREQMKSTLFSAIASIQEKRKVTVLPVQGPEDFADWLVVYAKRLKKAGRKGKYREPTVTFKKSGRGPSEQAYDILCSMNGIGPKQASAIVEHLPTLEALFNASKEEVLAIAGTGDATYILIREVYKARFPSKAK